ncbi:MAG: hypothetical protein E7356_02540 [Clostridiales bacterium]|nr:hypothetical protein [Clostridiales bacterium]
MNSKIAKRVISITVIALVAALIITTIVLAIVPKKMQNVIGDNYIMVRAYVDGTEVNKYLKNSDEFKKISELHEESLEDSLLSAIFQGSGKFDVKVKTADYSNVLSSVAEVAGTNVLVFEFPSQDDGKQIFQTLEVNGEVYKDSNSLNESTVEYDMIVMPLVDSDNYDLCTIYLANSVTKVSSYKVEFFAHQSELYDYVASLAEKVAK